MTRAEKGATRILKEKTKLYDADGIEHKNQGSRKRHGQTGGGTRTRDRSTYGGVPKLERSGCDDAAAVSRPNGKE